MIETTSSSRGDDLTLLRVLNKGIRGLSLPKFNRERYQGSVIREKLRASGALIPRGAKPAVTAVR